MRRGSGRRGFAIIEFTLIAIPIIFITISIIEASIGMWQFHSMEYAVTGAARYAATHGRTCSQNGNTCTITLGKLTSLIAAQAPGLNTSRLNVTLYTHATTTSCSPITTCLSSTALFPNSVDNAVNFDVKIVAQYPIRNPMPLFWRGAQASSGTYTLSATSRQRIVF